MRWIDFQGPARRPHRHLQDEGKFEAIPRGPKALRKRPLYAVRLDQPPVVPPVATSYASSKEVRWELEIRGFSEGHRQDPSGVSGGIENTRSSS